ncbi:efflux RND transporter periplasmic adaptor subunit [Myxococcota bacterium]|nr:efflux RND transporter periplasmic adaptor subunit [Myxococcota bacterium]
MTPRAPIHLLGLLLATACGHGAEDHGAGDHGHTHGPGGGHLVADDHGEEEGPTLAITRWTNGHELFVELDVPVAGRAFAYHAHVTRLVDNHAATSGTLTMRFEQDGVPVEAHSDPAVARPGIFAAQAKAPKTPGRYQLVFAYLDGEERAEWPGGEVEVGDGAPVVHAGEAEGEITFLKEAQWQVPFAVAPVQERPMAPVLEATGVVRPAPASTAIVAAPVEGLVAWAEDLPVVGRRVRRGERLATLIPAGAAEHWATSQAEVATARVDRDLAQADLRRVEGLAPDALVSERRLEEARAALARAEARSQAAQRRVAALTSGGAGAVPILAPADGLVVSVGAAHGQAVAAGTALVGVATGDDVLIEARVQARDARLSPVQSAAVRRGDWAAPRDLLAAGATVLTEALVFDAQTLSAPLSVLVPGGLGLRPGDLVELHLGAGDATPRLAVPRTAVVEINGQDVVFVQQTGESFARRRVRLGARDTTHVEVLQGLELGEMVVAEGGFDVHVASLSGALESHRH